MSNDNNGGQALVIPGTLLSKYGSAAELREYAHRLIATIPVRLRGGKTRSMTGREAGLLAQVCLLNQLNDPRSRKFGESRKNF